MLKASAPKEVPIFDEIFSWLTSGIVIQGFRMSSISYRRPTMVRERKTDLKVGPIKRDWRPSVQSSVRHFLNKAKRRLKVQKLLLEALGHSLSR